MRNGLTNVVANGFSSDINMNDNDVICILCHASNIRLNRKSGTERLRPSSLRVYNNHILSVNGLKGLTIGVINNIVNVDMTMTF